VKIIIAGNGKVGLALTKQLSAEGYDLTLIDSNNDVLESSVERYDVMAVYGNCASMEILEEANVEDADLLIAATSADEVNLLCCMTAHGMNPRMHTIARIRNPEYNAQAYKMRDVFGLSLAVNPELQTAMEVERLLKYPGFLKRDTFAKGRAEIVELMVDEHSKLCNVKLQNLSSIVKCKVLVCAVLREGHTVAPDGDFMLKANDRIFVTAPSNNLTMLLNNLGVIQRKVRRAILCGGGRVGYYLAQRLLMSGIAVQIIEQDSERCLQLASMLPEASVIHGDASDPMLLESENLTGCDALVTMTGLDELNMIISLYGRSMDVPHIVTKLGRLDSSNIVNSLPLGSVVCPKELCCNTIVRYVRAMQNQVGAAMTVHSIANGQVEAAEFRVDDTTLHCGEELRNIRLRKNVLIVCITKGAKIVIPGGTSSFDIGDTLVIVTSGDTIIHNLNEIFE
jgi:trk system potassium uptake protein TrkA